jgi:hypothetical protein
MVTESYRTTGLYISQRVRDKLTVRYGDRPVDRLILVGLTITNVGSVELKDIRIEVTLRKHGGRDDSSAAAVDSFFFVDGQCADTLERTNFTLEPRVRAEDPPRITLRDVQPDEFNATIQRPFLRPNRAYNEEELAITLFSNRDLQISVSGGGPTWGVKYERASSRQSSDSMRTIISAALLVVGCIIGFVGASRLATPADVIVLLIMLIGLVLAVLAGVAVYPVWGRMRFFGKR